MTPRDLPPNVRIVSKLAEDDPSYSVARSEVMAALSRAEDRHFWHRSRNRFIAHRLRGLGLQPPAHLLELGCGGGSVAAHLAGAGWRVTGVDGHLSRILEAAARTPTGTFVVHDLRLGLEPLGPERYDVVALFDVIEHLEDPQTALCRAAERVVSGGFLVGTVPALMSLWCEVDVRSGHQRRYTRRELATLLSSAPGVDVVEIASFHRLLVPPLWLLRRVNPRPDALERGLEVPWGPLNGLAHAALRAEQLAGPLLDLLRVPGSSLWFAGRTG